MPMLVGVFTADVTRWKMKACNYTMIQLYMCSVRIDACKICVLVPTCACMYELVVSVLTFCSEIFLRAEYFVLECPY